jgi:curved DNA-binding protein CbpA
VVLELRSWKDQNYYEILEVSPQASDEEIRIAYEKLKTIYNPGSPGIYALFSPEEVQDILIKVEEAYRVLSNLRNRKDYDRMLKEEGEMVIVPPPIPSAPHRSLDPDELKEALGSQEIMFSGESLRKIREFLKLSLDDVARETKIGKNALQVIEEENIQAFPAPIYLKGFLRSYAKSLGLDPYRVTSEYLERIMEKGYQWD